MFTPATDLTALLRDIGAFAYDQGTNAELADKLQDTSGSPVDRLFTAFENLYAFRELLGSTGLELLGKVSGFALAQRWEVPGKPGRFQGVYDGVLRDIGEPGTWGDPADDPEPESQRRSDGLDWRAGLTPDLETLKARRWNEVKAVRSSKEHGDIPSSIGLVQGDPASQVKINGLTTMALIAKSAAQPFAEDFTLADNTVAVLADADAAINFGASVGQYISAVYARARELRDAIDAATTPEELAAVDISTGWPAT